MSPLASKIAEMSPPAQKIKTNITFANFLIKKKEKTFHPAS